MKTELIVANIRIHFESQARRRRFVAFFYAAMAVICLAWCSVSPKGITGAGIIIGCMILGVTLAIIFSSISGDMREHGDEREMHRREHAYFKAYSILGYFVLAALAVSDYFRGHNPIAALVPVALRGGMLPGPYGFLLLAAGILYLTLPAAILLWTEPDMDRIPEGAAQ